MRAGVADILDDQVIEHVDGAEVAAKCKRSQVSDRCSPDDVEDHARRTMFMMLSARV